PAPTSPTGPRPSDGPACRCPDRLAPLAARAPGRRSMRAGTAPPRWRPGGSSPDPAPGGSPQWRPPRSPASRRRVRWRSATTASRAGRSMPAGGGACQPLAWRDWSTNNRDDAGQVEWAKGAGVDLIRGRGRLAGEKTVEVTAADGAVRMLRARQAVVVATGTTAAIPPVQGLREARPWTSRD